MNDSSEQTAIEAQRLKAFIGTWTVEGRMAAGRDSFRITGEWSFESAVEDLALLARLRTNIEEMGELEELVVIGADFESGAMHHVAVNKFVLRDHVGGWTDEETLDVVYTGSREGKTYREAITIRLSGQNQIEGTIIESVDEVVESQSRVTLTRKS